MQRYFLLFFSILLAISIGFHFSIQQKFFLFPVAKANYFNTSVQVYICGNGIIEGDELCDDGNKNGVYAFNAKDKNCNTSCNSWAPYCGDGIVQSEYGEECDDGNNINYDGCSAICTKEVPGGGGGGGSGGGGGGGGGYNPPPVSTVINFKGKAYPKSIVTLLKDAQIVATTISDENADFSLSLSNVTAGSYIFSVYSEDKEGNRSSLLTFPLSITTGITANVQSILISPTINTDKIEVKKGDIIKIFGQSAPNSEITIIVNSDEELYGKTKADSNGSYLYNLDTIDMAMADHLAKSRTTLENNISSLSKIVSFKVGTKTVLRPKTAKCMKADLNCDGRVNLIDFSIAAYWYKRNLSTDFKTIEAERLNGDGKIDLVDFSIMAYYWTG